MFDFTTQAWIYLIIGFIATTTALAMSIYKDGPGLYIIAYVLYFFILLLGAYNITCLTAGECYTWSWIYTLLTTLPMLLVIGLSIYTIASGSPRVTNAPVKKV
jgi:hypothetical protein